MAFQVNVRGDFGTLLSVSDAIYLAGACATMEPSARAWPSLRVASSAGLARGNAARRACSSGRVQWAARGPVQAAMCCITPSSPPAKHELSCSLPIVIPPCLPPFGYVHRTVLCMAPIYAAACCLLQATARVPDALPLQVMVLAAWYCSIDMNDPKIYWNQPCPVCTYLSTENPAGPFRFLGNSRHVCGCGDADRHGTRVIRPGASQCPTALH